MAIDKEKQVSASVVLDKDIYEQFKLLCKEEKRSVSGQIAYLIEQYIQSKDN